MEGLQMITKIIIILFYIFIGFMIAIYTSRLSCLKKKGGFVDHYIIHPDKVFKRRKTKEYGVLTCYSEDFYGDIRFRDCNIDVFVHISGTTESYLYIASEGEFYKIDLTYDFLRNHGMIKNKEN